MDLPPASVRDAAESDVGDAEAAAPTAPHGDDDCIRGKVHSKDNGRSHDEVPKLQALAVPLRGHIAKELCHFCFQVLLAHLERQPAPPFPAAADPSFRAPLFVTWLKRCGGERPGAPGPDLRGCIGCLDPITFSPGLQEYVLRSSLQDKRFAPVQLDEVPHLTCRLSILYQFEVCTHAYDWTIGTHGLLIHFSDASGKQYSATYLPEVALDHGMAPETAVRELMVKAGYRGACDQEILSRLKVTRYKTLVHSVYYQDFKTAAPVLLPAVSEALSSVDESLLARLGGRGAH